MAGGQGKVAKEGEGEDGGCEPDKLYKVTKEFIALLGEYGHVGWDSEGVGQRLSYFVKEWMLTGADGLSVEDGDSEKIFEMYNWGVEVLLAAEEDGSMFSRSWHVLDFDTKLPVTIPAWLYHKLDDDFKDDPELVTKVMEGPLEKPQGGGKVKKDHSEKPQGEGGVKEENPETPQGEDEVKEGNFEKPQGDGEVKEDNPKKPQGEGEVKKCNSEKPQGDGGVKEENSVMTHFEEEEVKEVSEVERGFVTPQTTRTEENSRGSSWTPRSRGRRSPGAEARSTRASRRRLLLFQARLEPCLGPSRLQLLQRGLTTPPTPLTRKSQVQAVNLLREFEGVGAAGRRAEVSESETVDMQEEGRSSERGAGTSHTHVPSTTPFAATPFTQVPAQHPGITPFPNLASASPLSPPLTTPPPHTKPFTPSAPPQPTTPPNLHTTPHTNIPFSTPIYTPFLLPSLTPMSQWFISSEILRN